MRYCFYRDVYTGKYDCPYTDVVDNTVVCTSKECKYASELYGKSVYEVFKNSICCNSNECNYKSNHSNQVVNNSFEDEDDECLSCPYFNPEAPDCCTYSPEACYYDPDPDTYPF